MVQAKPFSEEDATNLCNVNFLSLTVLRGYLPVTLWAEPRCLDHMVTTEFPLPTQDGIYHTASQER